MQRQCVVPMIPSFVAGNAHPTIPHSFRGRRLSGGMADTQPNRGTGSRLYEVNLWMWLYGRGRSERCRSESAWRQG